MNPGFDALQPYPFERLRALFADVTPADQTPIPLTIGEPRHAAPGLVIEALASALGEISRYPATRGMPALRQAIADWATQRFALPGLDPERQVLPVNGTREALFAIAQTLVTPGSAGRVVCPNPFYQIYEGAALLAGTTPRFIAATGDTNFLPDFASVSDDDWQRCELMYVCNPGNPSGAVIDIDGLKSLIERAIEFDFTIASDECYSEIYGDEDAPPPGLLQAAAELGLSDYQHCLVFHSLSKRSNLPGLRSGFVAGDADLLDRFFAYRTYHGCAMPQHHQLASIAAWQDETHVRENRQRYRDKFDAVLPILSEVLPVVRPAAGFYSWPRTPMDDEQFARRLLEACHVSVLPGQYLGRSVSGINPGAGHVRLAWVADQADCVEAAERIAALGRAGW
jgi:N-succinyldiaminopimelate aminotransferase